MCLIKSWRTSQFYVRGWRALRGLERWLAVIYLSKLSAEQEFFADASRNGRPARSSQPQVYSWGEEGTSFCAAGADVDFWRVKRRRVKCKDLAEVFVLDQAFATWTLVPRWRPHPRLESWIARADQQEVLKDWLRAKRLLLPRAVRRFTKTTARFGNFRGQMNPDSHSYQDFWRKKQVSQRS